MSLTSTLLAGVSIANAMGRLSVMIPILAGVLIWRQTLVGIQGVGVALAVLALSIATLCIVWIRSRIKITLRARNQVEHIIKYLLIACSTIATDSS